MRGLIYWRCLTWMVCLLLCTQALSAGAQGKKWALLIGIEEYDRAEISRMDFAVKDVNAIARALQLNLGYEPAHIRIMSSAIIRFSTEKWYCRKCVYGHAIQFTEVRFSTRVRFKPPARSGITKPAFGGWRDSYSPLLAKHAVRYAIKWGRG